MLYPLSPNTQGLSYIIEEGRGYQPLKLAYAHNIIVYCIKMSAFIWPCDLGHSQGYSQSCCNEEWIKTKQKSTVV